MLDMGAARPSDGPIRRGFGNDIQGEEFMTHGVTAPDFPDGAAIVFGGSGGLGRAICALLAERGTDVVFTYNTNHDAAAEVTATIEAAGRRAHSAAVRLEDYDAVAALFRTASERFHRVHSIIYASGPAISLEPIHDIAPGDFARVMQADAQGFFHIARAGLPHLRAGGGGSVTALGTTAVRRYLANDSLSAVPKAAIAQMVQAIAREEGQHNIRANWVGPGLFDAGIVFSSFVSGPAKAVLDAVLRETPAGRPGQPAELAEVVAFLASAKASYLSGQVLSVDGGFSA